MSFYRILDVTSSASDGAVVIAQLLHDMAPHTSGGWSDAVEPTESAPAPGINIPIGIRRAGA